VDIAPSDRRLKIDIAVVFAAVLVVYIATIPRMLNADRKSVG
jgi:hypothetical protein